MNTKATAEAVKRPASEPVSYTHLDVYKRQNIYSMHIKSNRDLIVCQPHQLIAEDAFVHQLDGAVFLISDLRYKFHLIKDLGLQINTGSDLDQGNAFRTQLEYRALGDVQYRLMNLVSIDAGEGDVLNFLNELLLFAFLQDVDCLLYTSRCV